MDDKQEPPQLVVGLYKGDVIMSITLTDKDGIQFTVNTLAIEEVHGSPLGSELVMATGEIMHCKESASLVMSIIVKAKFGGAL